MSSFVGVLVSDQWLQSQFTQVELRSLNTNFLSARNQSGKGHLGDLPPVIKPKAFRDILSGDDIKAILSESSSDMTEEIDFESFLRAYLNLQARATARIGDFLPIDPSTNQLFDLAKDGVLLCKLINVAVPNTIDERAINTKAAEVSFDFVILLSLIWLGLISQIIKIQLLADLNLKKTRNLWNWWKIARFTNSFRLLLFGASVKSFVHFNVRCDYIIAVTFAGSRAMSLSPRKGFMKWMNFHLKKAGYKKEVTNFSSDLKHPEHDINTLEIDDPTERANLIIEQAEKLDCKRYVTSKDIVEGSANLNLAFVAQIFQHRNGLTADTKKLSFAVMMEDDAETSREERCFRLWINSLGIDTYVNNLFEDIANWVGPFGAGNDIVQGNKKLILAFLWQLMRFSMLQLLKNLKFHALGKEITDVDILNWANSKVKSVGRKSRQKALRTKIYQPKFFPPQTLKCRGPRKATDVSESIADEDSKKLNATYTISVNQKMMLTLTASIMYWSLQKKAENSDSKPAENDDMDAPPEATPDGDIASTTSEVEELEEES
ncbi:phospholipid scramblase 1 [Datura stramonium]|uniref:Phospholipid scramblase 1 n=1 Tax=Datura stramonium TaxID=4076 RepID=A0ABS8UYM3_DATST|nr:phospholipid scramblase 1 [Datura stramonium]